MNIKFFFKLAILLSLFTPNYGFAEDSEAGLAFELDSDKPEVVTKPTLNEQLVRPCVREEFNRCIAEFTAGSEECEAMEEGDEREQCIQQNNDKYDQCLKGVVALRKACTAKVGVVGGPLFPTVVSESDKPKVVLTPREEIEHCSRLYINGCLADLMGGLKECSKIENAYEQELCRAEINAEFVECSKGIPAAIKACIAKFGVAAGVELIGGFLSGRGKK